MNMKKLILVSNLLVSGFSSAYTAAKIEECSLYVNRLGHHQRSIWSKRWIKSG